MPNAQELIDANLRIAAECTAQAQYFARGVLKVQLREPAQKLVNLIHNRANQLATEEQRVLTVQAETKRAALWGMF